MILYLHLFIALAVVVTLFSAFPCFAQEPAGTCAPIWAEEPFARVVTSPAAPKTDGVDPLSDASWQAADVIGPLSSGAALEPDGRRTEARMVLSGGTLYVGVRCFEPDPAQIKPAAAPEDIWTGDCVELLFAAGKAKAFPLVHVMVGASGRIAVERCLAPFGLSAEPMGEPIDPALIAARSGTDAKGWWAVVALPLEKLALPAPPAFANIMRSHAGEDARFTWGDIFGGRFQNPRRMGRLAAAAAPLPPMTRLKLPATLAVGANVLEVDGRKEIVLVAGPGTMRLAPFAGGKTPSAVWSADVRRPLIVSAAKPFANDPAGPLAVELTLAVAETSQVSVEVTQDGKPLGRKDLRLAAGKHALEIPLAGAKPGEVSILARADVPVGPGRTAVFEARHWCLVGDDGASLDRYRPDIEKLPMQALCRAAVTDGAPRLRLLQSGDGSIRVLTGRGELRFAEWNQGAAYLLALAYKADWPENPHRGDRRFLEAAALALDAETDPAKTQKMLVDPPNRDLQGALMAYDLIKDDVAPARRDAWKRGFESVVGAVVDTWVTPLTYRFTDYSKDVGTGTNHYAYHVFNVWYGGRTLGHPEWETLGRDMLRRLARHERDGQWAERRDVPATHYTWLTLHNVALYGLISGDEQVKDPVLRGAAFSVAMSMPGGETLTLFDGRNNDHGLGATGDVALMLTPEGRRLTRERLLKRTVARTPSRVSPEFWFYAAVAAQFGTPGDEKDAADPSEYPLLDGRGLIARRSGFIYGLSAISVPPIHGLFRLDPQNTLEVWHAKAGWVLHGCNSQDQPEAGSFFRKLADRAVFLPKDGAVMRTIDGLAARLEFDGFKAQVVTRVVSPTEMEVRAELISKTGDEPVVFNFFPGVDYDYRSAAAGAVTLDADGRAIRFRNVTISAGRAVQMERDLQIYNPYADRRGVRSKPVRAWCELEIGKPLVLTITIAEPKP